MIRLLANYLVKWCEKNNRVHYITGGPTGKTVYLVRYIVFKSKLCCVYIHRFMRSDADDPHDHPWNFFTYIISGGYTELHYKTEVDMLTHESTRFLWEPVSNKRTPGSLAHRRATDIHQVVLDRSYEMDEIDQAPFTVCLMGPRRRHWGFWPKSNHGTTWVDWREYLDIQEGDARIEGSE
jgi:hypothetical protein